MEIFWAIFIPLLIATIPFVVICCPNNWYARAAASIVRPAHKPLRHKRSLPSAKTKAHRLADACGGPLWEGSTLLEVITAGEREALPKWRCNYGHLHNGTDNCGWGAKAPKHEIDVAAVFTLPPCKGPEAPKEEVSVGRRQPDQDDYAGERVKRHRKSDSDGNDDRMPPPPNVVLGENDQWIAVPASLGERPLGEARFPMSANAITGDGGRPLDHAELEQLMRMHQRDACTICTYKKEDADAGDLHP